MIYGENKRVCCICGKEFMGMGNNPSPVIEGRRKRCCNYCNSNVVIPSRFIAYMRMKDIK